MRPAGGPIDVLSSLLPDGTAANIKGRTADMHVTYVRQFVELATTLNFTKAAARLAMSQSNLSRSIANLEREYGVAAAV